MLSGRITSDIPHEGEAFHQLACLGTTRIEHIVSSDTPETSLQRQTLDEWVLVLAGRAVLEVDGSSVGVGAGDWLLLPAGTPHRVVQTESGTHWLAVHAGGPDPMP
jgi:mannose-6-phosphate isomerase-like protein (cupin superfamily)